MQDIFEKADIVRVYSGRDGCACGCRGKYSTSKGSITKVYNKLMANIDLVDVDESYDFASLVINDRLLIAYTK
jgi:hypothetical protein